MIRSGAFGWAACRLRSLICLVVLSAGSILPFPAPGEARESRFKAIELFDKVFQLVRTRFVEKESPRKLIDSAIAGLIAGAKMDPISIDHERGDDTQPSLTRNDDVYRAVVHFGNLFERIRLRAAAKPNDEELVAFAINAMLADIDPHSSYMNSQSFGELQVGPEQGFGGAGVEITNRAGSTVVVSVFKESPADRAGVRPGDIITYVDDDPLDGLALQQVIRKLRGPTGSSMRLRLRRKGVDRPIDIAVSREIVRQHAVVTRAIDNVAYVRVTQFSNQATDELRQGITALQSKIPFGNLKGYIFDLRNNEGGLLDQSISVADAFLEQGEIVTTRARNPDEAQRFDAKPGDLIGGKPLIVLINGKTAGVSEIVACALQDHRRAMLLGSRTFGYGSVQTIIPLESANGALRLTTARYFTPSGRSIQAMGIVPDIQVLQDVPEDARSDADSKGEAALRAHLKGEGREETGSQSYVPPDPRDDKALQMAIGLLRGVRTHPAFRPNSKAVGAK